MRVHSAAQTLVISSTRIVEALDVFLEEPAAQAMSVGAADCPEKDRRTRRDGPTADRAARPRRARRTHRVAASGLNAPNGIFRKSCAPTRLALRAVSPDRCAIMPSQLRPKQDRVRCAHRCGSFVRRSCLVMFLIARGQAQRTVKKYYREYSGALFGGTTVGGQ